jgi:phytoene dehydrogenase-like protein
MIETEATVFIVDDDASIARFAPDFRDCILARSISSPAALERWNPNLIGATFWGAPWISDSFSSVLHAHSIAHRGPIFISAEHPLPLVEVSTEWPAIMPL